MILGSLLIGAIDGIKTAASALADFTTYVADQVSTTITELTKETYEYSQILRQKLQQLKKVCLKFTILYQKNNSLVDPIRLKC